MKLDLGSQTQGLLPPQLCPEGDTTGQDVIVLLSIQVTSFRETSLQEFMYLRIGLRNNVDVSTACVNVLYDLKNEVGLF